MLCVTKLVGNKCQVGSYFDQITLIIYFDVNLQKSLFKRLSNPRARCKKIIASLCGKTRHLIWELNFARESRNCVVVPRGGVLAEKLGRGVRPASQNPYPIYDQNLRFSLPYLWPNQKLIPYFVKGFFCLYFLAYKAPGGEEGKARMEGGGHDKEVASSKKVTKMAAK